MMCDTSGHTRGSSESISRFEDPVQLQVESYISNKQFSKWQHFSGYVSHHNAMAYDNAVTLMGHTIK
jgi:hypothetical protein